MSSGNKDEILASFQSITGIDDVGEAFSHLENANWDLMTAIQQVIPQENNVESSISLSSVEMDTVTTCSLNTNHSSVIATCSTSSMMNHFTTVTASTSSSSSSNSNYSRWLKNGHSNFSRPVAVDSFVTVPAAQGDDDIIDLASDMDLDDSVSSPTSSSVKQILLNIHFDQQVYAIRLPSNATIEQLKKKIKDATGVPVCRQALRGWPPSKLHEAQKHNTKLFSLGLATENELILIDFTEEGYMDYDNDEVNSRLENSFILNIVQQPEGTMHELNFSGSITVGEVKANVYYVTDIPVRHQDWTGWPSGCDNNSTLAQSGIQLNHHFILRNNANRNVNEITANIHNSNAIGLDSDSSADEFEDASDFNNCEEFFTDPPPLLPATRHLISNNTDDETTGTIEFIDNYKLRFGEPVPKFTPGSLEDTLKEACSKPARKRKLLAIYLHHGESILTNVFCDHLMKHESILQVLHENFILYGWDLTHETNKHLLLSSVTACISNTASLTVRNISIDKLPSILIIGRSRVSGRTSCEVLSVIHGNVGLDDLLSRLLESVEMYNEHLQVEIAEDDARAARDQVKAEQDMAYQEALQADIAKETAKRQKEAALAAERQRLLSEKAEEDARRESLRLIAEKQLPKEPSDNEADVSKIRIRKPTGEFIERRFFTRDTLQDLLNFVASNGFPIEEYKVIASWPRRDLTSSDVTQTLQNLKLYPQETVILEER